MKKNELLDIIPESSLCEDAREAWLEIASGKYDEKIKKIVKVYFTENYKNNNDLTLDWKQLRETFLENFDFRKSLIKFWQIKWLGKDNEQVREALKKQMTCEGETIEEIRNNYNKSIQRIFFENKKETKNKDEEETDPILEILSEWDQTKVILTKKYWWNIQTWTKLLALLKFADSKEQKDILDYLIGEDCKRHIETENIFKIIDLTEDNVYSNIWSIWRYKKWDEKKTLTWIISYIIDKHTRKEISIRWFCDAFPLHHFRRIDITEEERNKLKEIIENLFKKLNKESIEQELFKWLEHIFEIIDKINVKITIKNKNINIPQIWEEYRKRGRFNLHYVATQLCHQE